MLRSYGAKINRLRIASTNSPSLSLVIVLAAPLNVLSKLTEFSKSGLNSALSSLKNYSLSPYKLTSGNEEGSNECPNRYAAVLNYT